ncbi:hypothetical protein Atai01_51660 [Amycolatopsis taiwanensis]|uniref:Uncharacterized protein n=1 Tax=Amycolatopsis taiwanensis TaxID=342230 RepID=A0A9W6R6P7_9PSEU|nr:hypothetical protein Atai01_51660 [Amycolatopsis taiwanensis]
MNGPVSSRGNQGDRHARAPKARYRGGGAPMSKNVTQSRMERPVDTIAIARKLAEGQA